MRIRRSELDAVLEAGESGGSEAQPSAEDFWLGTVPVGEALSES